MNCRENRFKKRGVAVRILGGQNFKSPGNELPRKSIKKFYPPPGGRSANVRGSTNQKSVKCHELPRKVITKK